MSLLGEGGPGGLLRIVAVGMHAEDLELRGHGLVGEAVRADVLRMEAHRSSSARLLAM